MKRAALFSFLFVPLMGCEATPSPRAPDGAALIGYMTLRLGGKSGETFKVTTQELSSPSVQIERVPGGLRGTVRRAPIEMNVNGDDLVGALGGQPIHLRVERDSNKLLVHGLYGGKTVAFQIAKGGGDSCGALQPSLTLEGEPAPCETERTVQAMTSKLAENEAMALLSVVFFSRSHSYADFFPGASPPSLRSPVRSTTVPSSGNHGGRERG